MGDERRRASIWFTDSPLLEGKARGEGGMGGRRQGSGGDCGAALGWPGVGEMERLLRATSAAL
jgi:hypothetical protein